MNEQGLARLIEAGQETRHVEYKESHAWDNEGFKQKITLAILAMSNIRDGGTVVVGVKENQDGTYTAEGVLPEHIATFDEELVKDYVGDFADPHADFSLDKLEHGNKDFIVITVREFEQHPVVCKRDGRLVADGAIYVRTRNRRPESAKVPDHVHLREIIDLGVDKGMRDLRRRLSFIQGEDYGGDPFRDQLGDMDE